MAVSLPDPRHQRLLEWMVTPKPMRVPSTWSALAEELGVTQRTLQNWRERSEFREAWAERVKEVSGSPERVQAVIDALYFDATNPESRTKVQSAKAFLEAVNAVKEPDVNVRVSRVSELSDDELAALIAEESQRLLKARERGGGVEDA